MAGALSATLHTREPSDAYQLHSRETTSRQPGQPSLYLPCILLQWCRTDKGHFKEIEGGERGGWKDREGIEMTVIMTNGWRVSVNQSLLCNLLSLPLYATGYQIHITFSVSLHDNSRWFNHCFGSCQAPLPPSLPPSLASLQKILLVFFHACLYLNSPCYQNLLIVITLSIPTHLSCSHFLSPFPFPHYCVSTSFPQSTPSHSSSPLFSPSTLQTTGQQKDNRHWNTDTRKLSVFQVPRGLNIQYSKGEVCCHSKFWQYADSRGVEVGWGSEPHTEREGAQGGRGNWITEKVTAQIHDPPYSCCLVWVL